MEALSRLLDRARARGFLESWRVGGRSGKGEECSHLFVDDTLVFCKPDEDQFTHLSWVLTSYEV